MTEKIGMKYWYDSTGLLGLAANHLLLTQVENLAGGVGFLTLWEGRLPLTERPVSNHKSETGLIGVKSSCVQTTASMKKVKARLKVQTKSKAEQWRKPCGYVTVTLLVAVYRKRKELVIKLFWKPQKTLKPRNKQATTNKTKPKETEKAPNKQKTH